VLRFGRASAKSCVSGSSVDEFTSKEQLTAFESFSRQENA
jgi:hypothetical protein